ncbi:MAG: hypothetical protein LBH06_06465 [Rikenellaceae bacterium]|jgi:hypothetical protein|nr:hypothetical protein [Rikenellaceae bacterium]
MERNIPLHAGTPLIVQIVCRAYDLLRCACARVGLGESDDPVCRHRDGFRRMDILPAPVAGDEDREQLIAERFDDVLLLSSYHIGASVKL